MSCTTVVRVSIAQLCATSNVQHNLNLIERFAKLARSEASKILFLPENACFMGVPGTSMSLEVAESLGDDSNSGTIIPRLKDICKEQGLWISVGGFQEKVPGDSVDGVGKIHNTHIIIDDAGRIVAKYRKMHLFNFPDAGLNESALTVAGTTTEVCETPFGLHLGLSVCFDLRFPSLYQQLREKGANVMLIPAAFTVETGRAHWETLIRARAIETQSWVIAAAQSGQHNKNRSSYGHGMVVDPWGKVVACLEGDEELQTFELDIGLVDEVRRRFVIEQRIAVTR
jgi:deaminated glutathione amidase